MKKRIHLGPWSEPHKPFGNLLEAWVSDHAFVVIGTGEAFIVADKAENIKAEEARFAPIVRAAQAKA